MDKILDILSPGQIAVVSVGLLLALCGVIGTVGNAVEKILKVIRAAKAPNEAQTKRIDELESRVSIVERLLKNDDTRLKTIEQEHKAVLTSLLALLDHGLDGNNVQQMQDAKKALIHSLTNHL